MHSLKKAGTVAGHRSSQIIAQRADLIQIEINTRSRKLEELILTALKKSTDHKEENGLVRSSHYEDALARSASSSAQPHITQRRSEIYNKIHYKNEMTLYKCMYNILI